MRRWCIEESERRKEAKGRKEEKEKGKESNVERKLMDRYR